MKKRRRVKKKQGPGFKILLALFILFALGTAVHFCYSFLLGWDKLNVSRIDIKGLEVLNEDYVKQLLDMKTGANIFSYKLDEEKLLTEQWVASARLRRILPGRIIVRVKERVPAAMFVDKGRKFIITLDDQVVRTVSAAEEKYRIPQWDDYPALPEERRESVLTFLKELRAKENSFYEGIRSFAMEGESLRINTGAHEIFFGRPVLALAGEKVASVRKILADAADKGQQIQYIDLRPFTKKMRSAIIKFHKGVENKTNDR